MRALILNGAAALRDLAEASEAALVAELGARGYQVQRHDLTTHESVPCNGDFGCWTVTPGVCVQPGPHRDVARDLVQSDIAVYLTPVTFGGYSSALKNQLDHCIPLISHRFTTLQGETHHEPRYARFPSLLAVGLMERPEAEATRVFERLVSRNAINMHTPHFASRIVTRGRLSELGSEAGRWLDDLAASQPPRIGAEPLVLDPQCDLPPAQPRRALVLHGSPRGSASVSASIASYLAGLLAERGLGIDTASIHRAQRAEPQLRDLRAAVDRADVVALAAPLYVDSLPGPVTRALEILSQERVPSSNRRFLAILNSGFPEAVHNDTALAICRLFARQAKLDWLGGLAIGGGGMLAGKPLAQMGARARRVTRALTLTADAIVAGRPVPDEARRLVRQRAIPAWLYRFFGDRGFRAEAKKHGSLARLRDRPYAEPGVALRAP